MWGRSDASKPRAIAAYDAAGTAPAPNPWRMRPSTSTSIDGASPATARPAANSTNPAVNGTTRPRRSAAGPPTTMPTMLARKNPLNTQPYRS